MKKHSFTKAGAVLALSLLSLSQSVPILAMDNTSMTSSSTSTELPLSETPTTTIPSVSSTTTQEEPEMVENQTTTQPSVQVTETSLSDQTNAQVQVEDYQLTSPSFTVRLTGQADTQAVKRIRIAVWSEENGQDDLKWYRPTVTNNQAATTIHISNHANKSGKYVVHAYVTYENDQTIGHNLGTFEIQKPAPLHTIEHSFDTAGLQLSIRSTTIADYSKVRFAVWSEENGQDDLKWYSASKTGTLAIPYSKLSGYGNYQVHAYINENKKMVGLTTAVVRLEKPTLASTVTKQSDTHYTIDIRQVPHYVREVNVPVWSDKNGQDDLKWYRAKKVGADHYQIQVYLADHKFTSGRYQVHLYLKAPFVKKQFGAGAAEFEVADLGQTRAKLSIENVNHAAGSFDVIVSDLVAPRGLKAVKLPIWSEENGQDDLRWYVATKQANGTYKISVSAANHHYTSGIYHVHGYIVETSGKTAGFGTTTLRLDVPKLATKIQTAYQGMGNYTLRMEPVYTSGKVKYAVWSEDKGQDDLRWYTANRNSQFVFLGQFNAQDHAGTGKYQIHAYEEVNGKLKGLATTTVQVSKSHYQAPYFSQLDPRWSNIKYGMWYFGPTGCVPATMAMIISGIKGTTVTPEQVGNYLHYNTMEFNRNFLGTSSRGVVLSAKHWGLKANALNSYAALETALKQGYYVAAGVGPSKYIVAGGHEIVLKGYKNGQTYVLDPYNPSNNGWTSLSYIWGVPSTDPIDRTEGMPFIRISD